MTIPILMSAVDGVATSGSDDLEEARWVALAKTGDQAAYRWLLARYRHRAVSIAAHVLRRESEAEDVAQEAFIRAFQEITSLRAGRFRPWLYKIVLRICLDRKRLARWTAEQPMDASPETASAGSVADTVTEQVVVGILLDRLTPPMRAVLALRELEGLDYDEIALVLSIPIGTVRSRLNTARSQFRALWKELGDAE